MPVIATPTVLGKPANSHSYTSTKPVGHTRTCSNLWGTTGRSLWRISMPGYTSGTIARKVCNVCQAVCDTKLRTELCRLICKTLDPEVQAFHPPFQLPFVALDENVLAALMSILYLAYRLTLHPAGFEKSPNDGTTWSTSKTRSTS